MLLDRAATGVFECGEMRYLRVKICIYLHVRYEPVSYLVLYLSLYRCIYIYKCLYIYRYVYAYAHAQDAGFISRMDVSLCEIALRHSYVKSSK